MAKRKLDIKHIKINNFCSIKELDADLSKNTIIKGKNAVGKSTIRNAITWVLFDKLADGSSASGIRPHDENGKDIDFLDIIVELTCVVDGRDIVITKKQSQNWVKNRSTQEQEFKGNENEYMVNGIPKKDKDFKTYLEENIADTETLMLCMNPFSFLGLNTAKRRSKLFDLVSKFSDKDVIKKNKEYKVIENDLKDGTLEELIARSKKAISSLKKTLDELPARIDEVSKLIVDEDFAEYELLKTSLDKELKDKSDKRGRLHEKIMDLNFELNDYKRERYEENHKKQLKLNDSICVIKNEISSLSLKIVSAAQSISDSDSDIKRFKEGIKQLDKDLKQAQNIVFDDSRLVCSECGQSYPEKKKNEIKANFEKNRKDKIYEIGSKISEHEKLIADIKETTAKIKLEIKEMEKKKASKEKELDKLSAQLHEIDNVVDLTNDKKYVKISNEIKKYEEELELIDISQILNQINDVNSKLSVCSTSIGAADRVDELKKEQRKTAQLIADQEKMLDLLERFNRDKISMITDSINDLFNVITWVMFEKQINGGYKEVCNAYVNGTSYDGLLNHGDKLLSEIDICRAFSKANNIEVPIIVDDTESLDSNRVPKLSCQLITLRRTDDSKLLIGGE